MTGLRERQKSKRRKSMLQAALQLFRERGYDAVKLEEIADRADVSVGTVYTYFKTKNALLLAVIVDDFENAFSCSTEVLENPIDDGQHAIQKLTRCYFQEIEGGVTREMWRVAIAAFMRDPASNFSSEYQKCLVIMQQQYVALVRRLQEERLLSLDVDPAEFASVLYNNANMCFMEHLREKQETVDDLMDRIRGHNALLLKLAGTDGQA